MAAVMGYESMDGENTLLKAATADMRRGFVRKVYGILSVQLVVTVCVAAPLALHAKEMAKSNPTLVQHLMLGSAVLSIATICAMSCCQNLTRSFPTNYILLGIFTVTESVMVGFVCAAYPMKLVLGCFVLTAFIFIGLSIYAWTTKTDFTGFGPYLFGALLTAIIIGFGLSMFGAGDLAHKALAGLMVLIFVFYIIYDTQLMLGCYKGHSQEMDVDDYVFAALNLYLDILNLFLYLLQMLGDNKS